MHGQTRSIAARATEAAFVYVIFGFGPGHPILPAIVNNDNEIGNAACARERGIVELRRGFKVVG